jgi:hypothetical protein
MGREDVVGGEKPVTMSCAELGVLWYHERLVRKSRDMEGIRNGMQRWIDVRSSSPNSLIEERGFQKAHMTEEGRMEWLEGGRQEQAAGVGSTRRTLSWQKHTQS